MKKVVEMVLYVEDYYNVPHQGFAFIQIIYVMEYLIALIMMMRYFVISHVPSTAIVLGTLPIVKFLNTCFWTVSMKPDLFFCHISILKVIFKFSASNY